MDSKELDKSLADDSENKEKKEVSDDNKDEGSLKDCDTRSNKSSSKKSDRERGSSREDKKRSWDRMRLSRSKSRERPRRDNVLSFDKIKVHCFWFFSFIIFDYNLRITGTKIIFLKNDYYCRKNEKGKGFERRKDY